MFSDTHFHFGYLHQALGAEGGSEILRSMAERKVYFGMDIGIRSDDLQERVRMLEESLSLIQQEDLRNAARSFLYVSAGIWPDTESIKNRSSAMAELQRQIELLRNSGSWFSSRIAAIGEGGLDHHWNPSGADGRNEEDFDASIYEGERELFLMQLLLAKKENLPFIVHSRDAYEDTAAVIRESGVHRGIIHCYSYGLEEARVFLDLGWHISFSGSITYTKKSRMEEMEKLLRFIPEDRIILETDSPYLAPVPERGKQNNPLLVEHTYAFAARARSVTVEKLCRTVDENIASLFGLKPPVN